MYNDDIRASESPHKLIARLHQYLDRLIWGKELPGPEHLAGCWQSSCAICMPCCVISFSGQLTMRAMSLVYTTLLSVVPLLAFSFAISEGLWHIQ